MHQWLQREGEFLICSFTAVFQLLTIFQLKTVYPLHHQPQLSSYTEFGPASNLLATSSIAGSEEEVSFLLSPLFTY
jgi:hypothetical protein